MRERVEKLEKENSEIQQLTEKKMDIFNSKIQDVQENAILTNKMNSSLRDLLAGNKDTEGQEIFSEMSLEQVNEFLHNQKRINANLNLKLELLERKLKESNRQVAIYNEIEESRRS